MRRSFDLLVAFLALSIFVIPIIILIIIVRLKLGSPVFFKQTRAGLKGAPFEIIKFRTMIDKCNSDGQPLPDHMRLTSFGRLLRATSLDEIPELLNVLKGDMSIVGPRPLLVEYLPLYSPEQARRHYVRPGITGWAQINGRNAISWEDKFTLDIWYVDNNNIWLDIKILYLTVTKVLIREGINASGEATMARFIGSKTRE